MIKIEDIALHDAYIAGLDIRTLNDHFEYISVNLEVPELRDVFHEGKIKIVFEGCYKAKFNLQMWIKGRDTIRSFGAEDNSDWVKELISLQNKGLLPKSKKFNHFIFELNTSGSIIEILAEDIKIEPLK